MDEQLAAYWQKFQDTLPADSACRGREYLTGGWGDSPAMADDLGGLIAAGVKTATCSALWSWQADGEQWSGPGTLTIVLDGRGQPLCIVETVEISLRRYDEVDASFAFDEGEGDRSLSYWRAEHRSFFTRDLQKIGREFSEDMPLVCERFKLVFR